MLLLDTDVLIDYLRGAPPARAWLDSASKELFAIPGIVAMELVIGCRNQIDLQQVQKFLRTFNVVWPEAPEFVGAYELLCEYCLKSGLSIPDCLIAAMTLSRKAQLCAFNVKHFGVIPGLNVHQPYARN